MKTRDGKHCFSEKFSRAIIVAGFLFGLLPTVKAVVIIPGFGTNSGPIYTTLDSWSFHDQTNWTSDLGYNPVSFSNLSSSVLGNGSSLVVDTNLPAWLQFNIVESSGATNFSPNFGSDKFQRRRGRVGRIWSIV